MEVKVTLLCKHDIIPGVEFPHEFSDWADDAPVTFVKGSTDLTRQVFTGMGQVRTVTTEGLRGPVHGALLVAPPKYPPLRGEINQADSDVVLSINSDARFMVLAVDDIGNGVPAWGEDKGLDDPIGQTLWDEMATKIEAVTRSEIGDPEADQVATALANWRSDNPEGTAREFMLALRRFTS